MLAPNRRFYEYEHLALESTDLDVYDELFAAVGDSIPFYMDPPDDGEDPRFVQIEGRIDRSQYSEAPKSTGELWRVRFRMMEVTT
jgi:hypothetical protein